MTWFGALNASPRNWSFKRSLIVKVLKTERSMMIAPGFRNWLIGRIEVLPIGAPAPAAAAQPNPAQAQARAPQSLESYLAERRRS